MSEEEKEFETNSTEKHPTEKENNNEMDGGTERRHVMRRRIPRGEKMGEMNPFYNRNAEERPRMIITRNEERPPYGPHRENTSRPYYREERDYYREPREYNHAPREYNRFDDRSYSRYPRRDHDAPQYERQSSYGHRSVRIYGEDKEDYSNHSRVPYHRAASYEHRGGYPQSYQERPWPNYRDRQDEESHPRGREWQENPNYSSRPMRFGHQGNKLPHKTFTKKAPLTSTPHEVVRYKEMNVDLTQPIRLNKYLANSGICSRRDADAFIQQGFVAVNGNVVTEMGVKVLRTDEVTFKGKKLTLGDKVYVLLNKPINYVTTSEDPANRKTVMDLVKNACPERIYPVGRLDRNTTGVLLLTNDGELAATLAHPKFLKKKIYHVFLNEEVKEEDMEKIRTGIQLEDGEVKADAVEYAKDDDHKQVGIEIHSGKNRIVRRIFENLGYRVYKLDRVYFAGLTKKNLKRGQWRYLTTQEVSMLKMGAFE